MGEKATSIQTFRKPGELLLKSTLKHCKKVWILGSKISRTQGGVKTQVFSNVNAVLTLGLNHIVVSNFQSLRDCVRLVKDFNQYIRGMKQLICNQKLLHTDLYCCFHTCFPLFSVIYIVTFVSKHGQILNTKVSVCTSNPCDH